MATKKTSAKKETIKEEKTSAFSGKYAYAVGRRKESVAQVRIYEQKQEGEYPIEINGRDWKNYFPTLSFQNVFLTPLRVLGLTGKFAISIHVKGGGQRGQVEASQLGVARALAKFNEELKKPLRDNKLLTRDARAVERKKPGLKKARRAPQWAKR